MPVSSCVPLAVPLVTHRLLLPAMSTPANITKSIGFVVMRPSKFPRSGPKRGIHAIYLACRHPLVCDRYHSPSTPSAREFVLKSRSNDGCQSLKSCFFETKICFDAPQRLCCRGWHPPRRLAWNC